MHNDTYWPLSLILVLKTGRASQVQDWTGFIKAEGFVLVNSHNFQTNSTKLDSYTFSRLS